MQLLFEKKLKFSLLFLTVSVFVFLFLIKIISINLSVIFSTTVVSLISLTYFYFKFINFNFKKIFIFILAGLFLFFSIFLINILNNNRKQINFNKSNKLNVVATIFPIYDFVNQVASDKINLNMLMLPGVDTHTFEPTPADIRLIEDSDILFYIGGPHDSWIDRILSSIDENRRNKIKVVSLINMFTDSGATNNEKTIDYHIWTSLEKSIKMVNKIGQCLAEIDGENANFFLNGAENYSKKLSNLKENFEQTIINSKRNVLVFADKFPFKHFIEEFKLNYKTPYVNCSAKTEASALNVANLVNFINSEQIPIVLTTDQNDGEVSKIVLNETNAKIATLFSCHTISKIDFEKRKTYLNFMEDNLNIIKEALN